MTEVEDVARVRPRPPDAPGWLASGAWLGMVVGLVELGLLLVEKQQHRVATIGALRLNRHYPWMIPTAHLMVFGAVGLALAVVRRLRPRVGDRIGATVLGFLACFALLSTIRGLSTLACALLACGIASQLVPRASKLTSWAPKGVRISLSAMAVGLFLMLMGCLVRFSWLEHRSATKSVARGKPNVVFVVLDTVRARSLSLHGYGRQTSPRLERLARSGVKFDQARSSAPWTLPSHATMFTGRWPSELFRYHEQELDPSVPTLAGYLGQNGYATAGFVANMFYCNSGFGLDSGFDHYEDFESDFDISVVEVLRNAELGRRLLALAGFRGVTEPAGRKDADRINRDFLAWLSTRDRRPFFAFLNYLDAHAPYFTPAGAEHHFGLTATTPDEVKAMTVWDKREYIPDDDPRQVEMARDAYDDCIAYLDSALGRLFDELDQRGLMDNTLVIVTADHGEEIGEHRLVGHGRSLYRDELHVPLLIVRPGRVPSGRVVAEPVSLRDLPSTVVDLVGLSAGSPFPGRSLAPLWTTSEGSPKPEVSVVRSEVAVRARSTRDDDRAPAIRGPMVSIVDRGMSYIRNADGREEVYRLADDPEQSRDLSGDDELRPTLERLRALSGSVE